MAYTLTWTNQTNMTFAGSFTGLAYGTPSGSPLYLVCNSSSTATDQFFTSSNGIIWTSRTGILNLSPKHAAWDGSKFVAITNGWNSTVHGAYSANGTSWSQITITGNNALGWADIWYDNGLFVIVKGDTNYPTYYQVATSANGTNWTQQTCPAGYWRRVRYGNGTWVAIGMTGSTNTVMTSTDGTNWVGRGNLLTNTSHFDPGLTYASHLGKFFATDSRYIFSSTNGTSWTQVYDPGIGASSFESITYGAGVIVAIGSYLNLSVFSVDGINWYPSTNSTANIYYDVIYGGGLFVATGPSGTNRIQTSTGLNATHVSNFEFTTIDNSLNINDFPYGSIKQICETNYGQIQILLPIN